MKTVWLLNHYAQEPGGSGGTRHYALARHARKHGVRIILIAASVEHFSGRQRLVGNESKRLEVFDGVEFLWVRTSLYTGNGPGRMRNMLEYTFRVLRASVTCDLPAPDLIVGSSVHPFAALAAQHLAKRERVAFVFEVRDLWPETLIQMGRLKTGSIVARVMRRLERRLYRKAARIVTLLPQAHEYIEPLGVDRNKIIWLPNGVDLDFFPYREPMNKGPLTVMYFGAMGQANGLDTILDAIQSWRNTTSADNLRFRFVGDGPLREDLMDRATGAGLDGLVEFLPTVRKTDIPVLAANADAFIVNVRDLPLYRYGISMNKLFDYLAAGRPIIFAGSAANNPVADAGAGICVAGDDVDGMVRAMRQLSEMSFEMRRALGRKGRAHVAREYAYSVLAARLCDTLAPLFSESDEVTG